MATMVSIEDLFQAIPRTRGLPIRLLETLPSLDPPRLADLTCFPEARAILALEGKAAEFGT